MRFFHRYFPVFFLCLVAFTSASAMQSPSLRSVLDSVLSNNVSIRSAQMTAEADVLDLKSQNTLSGPSVEFSPFFQRGDGIVNTELIVSEEFDFPTKYASRRRQASVAGEAFDKKVDAVRSDILLQTALVCFELVHQNQLADLLVRRSFNADSMLVLYLKKFDAGEASILELNKIKLECLEVSTSYTLIQSERRSLLLQLQNLNGGKPIEFTSIDYPDMPDLGDLDSFVLQFVEADAELKAVDAELKAQQLAVGAARQSWLPSLTVGYRRNTEMDDVSNGLLVGASFPLFSSSASMRSARVKEQNLRLQSADRRACAEAQARACYAELVDLQRLLNHYDVQMLRQTLQLMDKTLKLGQISSTDYYAEIGDIYSKLQSYFDLYCQYAKLYVRLNKNALMSF